MKKQSTLTLKLFGILCLMLLALPSVIHAQKWELIKELKATYAIYETRNGNMLLSDYLFDQTGGIYISKDKGTSWTKTDIADYNYNLFMEAGDYVFAIGIGGHIARSNDGGETWEMLRYTKPLEAFFDASTLDYTVSYALTYHNNRLYVADFNGGGILYSEDFGETWKLTDRTSLFLKYEDKETGEITEYIDSFYNLVSFNNELFAFSVLYVYRYDETNDTWIAVRDDSNFMAVSTIFNGKMYNGRSVMNDSKDVPFLERTADGKTWETVKRPEGQNDNNIRVLASDDKNIYAGLQFKGIYFTSNEGESWVNISEGLPYFNEDVVEDYLAPLKIVSTDDYLYVAIYDTPFSERKASGVYRMDKASLPSSIESGKTESANVYVDNDYLYVGEATNISIFNICGKRINAKSIEGKIAINNLSAGIYLYEMTINNKPVSGKFIKK